MFYQRHFNSLCRPITARGFGLVELMVSISIMMLLTTVILVRQSSFNGAVLLRSQAYEVAFALRRAQLMAVSGNNSGVTISTSTQQYGVYFDTAKPNTYFIYHDINANGQWDPGATPPDVQVGLPGTIDKRFKIRKITDADGGSTDLTGSGTGFNITFIRPNFDAKFNDMVDSGYESTNPVYIDIAQVNAVSSDDSVAAVRRIEVGATGEISVTNYP